MQLASADRGQRPGARTLLGSLQAPPPRPPLCTCPAGGAVAERRASPCRRACRVISVEQRGRLGD